MTSPSSWCRPGAGSACLARARSRARRVAVSRSAGTDRAIRRPRASAPHPARRGGGHLPGAPARTRCRAAPEGAATQRAVRSRTDPARLPRSHRRSPPRLPAARGCIVVPDRRGSRTPPCRHCMRAALYKQGLITTGFSPRVTGQAREQPDPSSEGGDMKAVTWHGKRDVRVETVPDPTIQEPTDAIIQVTTTNICGSDLHLYEVLGPFMDSGDILGHEPMGIVTEVGRAVGDLSVGDRVVIPFQMSCGHCWMCDQQLYTQCETTQVKEHGSGAALFGYSKLYGSVPGGQAEYLRVPQAQFTHVKVPVGPPDERFVYLSDVLPTAWQAVAYADTPKDGTLLVLGLGPIGDMATRIAAHHGLRVIGVALVRERLGGARARGIEPLDLNEHKNELGDAVSDLTAGRGADAVVDA